MWVERLTREESRRLRGPEGVARHLRSLVPEPASVSATVGEIVADVRARGEQAVVEWTRSLDTRGADVRPLCVPGGELDEAIRRLPLEVVAGLQVAIANVAQVAQASTGAEAELTLPQGQRIRVREQPVGSAAVYVPGGRAPYPSTAVMGVVTARAAGVVEVCVCTPPGPDGQIDTVLLGTCRLLGVERVYRMGGAQAVAALAYGTESVAPVEVIVGPGNLYVQEAKRQLSAVVGIDGFAGPSDLLVILAADGDAELAALDLAAQAEHGPGSLVAAISHEVPVLDALADRLADLSSELAGPQRAACVLIESTDLGDALRIAERFGPEHLQLMGRAAEALAPRSNRPGACSSATPRRPPSGTMWPARTTSCRRAARRASPGSRPAPFPPSDERGPHRDGRGNAGVPRAPRSRVRRASSCTRARWRHVQPGPSGRRRRKAARIELGRPSPLEVRAGERER